MRFIRTGFDIIELENTSKMKMSKEIDIVALGELLIDFTESGYSKNGMKLFEQNPGGAPANLLTAASHMGCSTAFVGKVGNDMHGHFLKRNTEKGRN